MPDFWTGKSGQKEEMRQAAELKKHNDEVRRQLIERMKKRYLYFIDRGDSTEEAIEWLMELTGWSEHMVKSLIVYGMPTSAGLAEIMREHHGRGKKSKRPRERVGENNWGHRCLPRKDKKAREGSGGTET